MNRNDQEIRFDTAMPSGLTVTIAAVREARVPRNSTAPPANAVARATPPSFLSVAPYSSVPGNSPFLLCMKRYSPVANPPTNMAAPGQRYFLGIGPRSPSADCGCDDCCTTFARLAVRSPATTGVLSPVISNDTIVVRTTPVFTTFICVVLLAEVPVTTEASYQAGAAAE
jgi:hypothetical protein